MKELSKNIVFIALILLSACKSVDTSTDKKLDFNTVRGDYRIMFYNCENFFDTKDDSLINDDEFTPNGSRYWTYWKYKEKLDHIYKVITAVGGWEAPDFVGLCEIENRSVLDDLVGKTPLKKWNYQIIHKESPDHRGIDVALLYRKEAFKPLEKEFIAMHFPNSDRKTRDLLYVKGKISDGDTLFLFVNHWPSRWSGQLESEPARMFVAQKAKHKTDSILNINPNAKIILMGDFNDEPLNKSLSEVLKAQLTYDKIENVKLYNISYYLQKNKGLGSHKYQGTWGLLDQFVVSGDLLTDKKTLHTSLENVHIFNQNFLLEKDETYVGFKPYRTFVGYKYNGGFSDHLPTYLDLFKK